MGRNPHMLPGYLFLWATIPPSPLYASMEVHRTGAPTVQMGLPCSYCHFFAVSITPAVKSSNATTKVMPHLTNAALSLMPPINIFFDEKAGQLLFIAYRRNKQLQKQD